MSKPNLATYRITTVTALPEKRLRVEYVGGTVIEVNLSELIAQYHAMHPLNEDLQFSSVRVGDYGWTAIWNDGTEISADRLMEIALEQQGHTDAVEFRRWQERNHLSLTEAAKAIGLTRRTVSQYRTGARPVPRTVTLACKGWEAERNTDITEHPR